MREPALCDTQPGMRTLALQIGRSLLLALVAGPSLAAAALGAPAGARSVEGRPIEVTRLGSSAAQTRILVVGCVHGDECAGVAVARRLETLTIGNGAALWIVENLNPDGYAGGTRQNAHGVDLNRNFPYAWHAAGRPFDQQYPGPRRLSEPESQLASRLILQLRPTITIWFHQPLDLVDRSGGDRRIERRFADAAGLQLVQLERYPGSATGWQNHRLPGTTSFVVELPAGRLGHRRVDRLVRAVLSLLPPSDTGRH